MFIKFDLYDRIETPQLVLCELSKERLCTLKALHIKADLNYTDVSTITFDIPMLINGEKYKYYDLLKELRLIYVENIGYFQLHDVIEKSNGIKSYKECKALSIQSIFATKRISGIQGEYKLYDLLKPNESLMGILLTLTPGWKVGNVDGAILTRQRTINVTEQDLYSLMTDDFYTAFECIFVFDYDKFLINIYDATKTFKDTEIFMSFHNLLKETTVTPQVDNIITALKVIGGDGLDISGVNPNGTDTIYNVNYYKDRMTTGLRSALTAYENKYNSLQPTYSNLLLQYKNKNTELSLLKNNTPNYNLNFTANQDGTASITPTLTNTSGLAELVAVRKALEGVRAVRISQGNISYSDVNNYIIAVEAMITNKNTAIVSAENYLNSLSKQIISISMQLKMENNFTSDQWIELNGYFRYDTVQENTFVITDIMTQEEKQAKQLELLDFGNKVLERACVPKYMFDISSVNFLALIQFQKFIDQFELGTTFTLMINDDYAVKPLLLGVHINFDDLSDFTLKYGNKTSLDEGFDFSALKDSVSMGTNISFDLVKLEAMKNQNDEVTEFINGALDLTNNNIINKKDKTTLTIDDTWIMLNEYDFNTGRLLPYEIRMTGKQIVFSDNNFSSTKMAIGLIDAPGQIGGKVYGVVADAIIGRLLAGNSLSISNDKNNFLLDDTGAWLNNANFTLTKVQSGITNKIVLDPNEGFAIYRDIEKQIYLGTDGNMKIKGDIFGGSLNINNQFIVDSNGYMTANNAYIKGTIESSQINTSTMNGGQIIGSSINIGNGAAWINSSGYAEFQDIHIRNNSSLLLSGGNTSASIDKNGYLYAKGGYFDGTIYARDGQFTGKIIASAISGGTITGVDIMGGTIRGGKYYNLNGTAYLEVGNDSYGDFTFRSGNGRSVFGVFDSGSKAYLRAYGTMFLESDGYNTNPMGSWNFSSLYVGNYSVATSDSVSVLRNDITYLNSDVSSMFGKISSLESRVSALESSYTPPTPPASAS